MQLISNSSDKESDFKELMASHSDNELKEILRKRKLYQKEAAREAINEAISRGLINSEEDLKKPDFAELKLKKQLSQILMMNTPDLK